MIDTAISSRASTPGTPPGFFDGERQAADHPAADRPAARRASIQTTLFYDPPYESDLDDRLARYLIAYLSPAASLEYKGTVWTPWMECRFDFLIDLGTRRVAIDYTDTPEDLQRALVEDNDALSLGSSNVDAIYRMRRQDLEDCPFDVLHLLAVWEPALFTPYGRRIFAANAAAQTCSSIPGMTEDLAVVQFEAPVLEEDAFGEPFEWPEIDRDDELVIRRLGRDKPSYWEPQYQRASLIYGMKWVMRKVQPPENQEAAACGPAT